ncbi:MAG TPA: hypothetical protein VH760_07290 [Gaiellaceae bacterium]
MAVEWTGLDPELLLRFDRASAEPLHSQPERELREAIRQGGSAASGRAGFARASAKASIKRNAAFRRR